MNELADTNLSSVFPQALGSRFGGPFARVFCDIISIEKRIHLWQMLVPAQFFAFQPLRGIILWQWICMLLAAEAEM